MHITFDNLELAVLRHLASAPTDYDNRRAWQAANEVAIVVSAHISPPGATPGVDRIWADRAIDRLIDAQVIECEPNANIAAMPMDALIRLSDWGLLALKSWGAV